MGVAEAPIMAVILQAGEDIPVVEPVATGDPAPAVAAVPITLAPTRATLPEQTPVTAR